MPEDIQLKETGGAATIHVTIVTPSGTQEEYDVRHIRLPGSEGEFGVLPGHIPFLTTLKIGPVYMDTAKERIVWAVSGGFVEVLGDAVMILAETAERADQIDRERAEAARQRASGRLRDSRTEIDVNRAQAALARAVNRLNVMKS